MEHKEDPMEVCRTCMTTTASSKRNKLTRKQLVPVFAKLNDAFIANIITDCTGVQISENDGLPSTICSDCFETVKLLVAFIKATRECDIKLRMLWKVESLQEVDCDDPMETTEADAPHFLDIKCEAPEQMEDETAEVAYASERGDVEPDNDTDTDWKASGDEELERSTKRRNLGLRSKPKPRRRKDGASVQKKRGRAPRKEDNSEDSLMLNKEERELFTVINIAPNSHLCCGCLRIFESAEELDAHRETQHVWKNDKLHKPGPPKHECQGCLRRFSQGVKRHQEFIQNLKTIWECKKCKKRFKVSGKRREHMKRHAEGMPVALVVRINESTQREVGWKCCALKCGQSFDTEKDLIAHAQEFHWADKLKADKESAIKPEQCQICFRRFTGMKQLVGHQRKPYIKPVDYQCAKCGLKLTSSAQVRAHEAKVHGSKRYHCKICDKIFTTIAILKNHIAVIHEKSRTRRPQKRPAPSKELLELNELEQQLFTVIEIKPNSHTCCGCLQVFESPEELELHRETTHVRKVEKLTTPLAGKHRCDCCLRRYGTSQGVKMHKDRVRVLRFVWQCNRCKKRFKLAGKRREHSKLHAAGKPVALVVRIKEETKQKYGWLCCAVECDQSFATESELITHGNAAHWLNKQKADQESELKPEQCQICFHRFTGMDQLVHHQRKPYYLRDKFQCTQCGLKFISTAQLNSHGVKVHGGAKFQCHICEKLYISEGSVARHIELMHETEGKPHQCNVCGLQFRQKSGLKVHLDTHKDYADFKCEYCPKAFKSKQRLMYHVRTHTGEKPYKCRICGHAFANHTNCRRHEMTHTGEKPHKCSYCEKSFILRRMLLEHEAVHTGVKYNRRVRNQQSTEVQGESIVEHDESIELDEDYYDESSNDTTYQQSTAQAVETITSKATNQSAAIAVYNILPSKYSK